MQFNEKVKRYYEQSMLELLHKDEYEPLKYGIRMLVICRFKQKEYEKINKAKQEEFIFKEDAIPAASYGDDKYVYMFFRVRMNLFLRFEYTKKFMEENNYPRSIFMLNYSPWVVRDLLDDMNEYQKGTKEILQFISNYREPEEKELFERFCGVKLPEVKLPEKYDFTKEGKIYERTKK